MDGLDKTIQKLGMLMHEHQRQEGVAKRLARDSAAIARGKVEELADRVDAHFPIKPRDTMPQLSDKQYVKYVAERVKHRTALLFSLVGLIASRGAPDDEMPESPLNF